MCRFLQQPRCSLSRRVCGAQGDWVFGKRHGYGHYYYLDGGKYEGEVGADAVSRQCCSRLPSLRPVALVAFVVAVGG